MSASTVYLGAAACPVQSETCSLCRASSGSARVKGRRVRGSTGLGRSAACSSQPVAAWLTRSVPSYRLCGMCWPGGSAHPISGSADSDDRHLVRQGFALWRGRTRGWGCGTQAAAARRRCGAARRCSMPCAVVEAQRARLVWQRGAHVEGRRFALARAELESRWQAVLAARRRRSVLTRCGAAFAGLRARCARPAATWHA